MSEVNSGGIRSTTVKYTGNGKPFGADVFISVDVVHEWPEPVDDETVLRRQEELSGYLTLQVLDLLKNAAEVNKAQVEAYRAKTPAAPAYQAPVYQAPSPAPSGVYHGDVSPFGTDDLAVVAVANGATPQQGDWVSVPSRFGDGQVRFISSRVYPSDQLKADVHAWIARQGYNPAHFDVWDERTGPRGAEAGNAIGSVFNIKVSKDSQHLVPPEFAKNAAGRGKFNNDGSIYPYWSKDFESFLKYGGSDRLA